MIHEWQLNTPLTYKEACDRENAKLMLQMDNNRWKDTVTYHTGKEQGLSDEEIKAEIIKNCNIVIRTTDKYEELWYMLREQYPYLDFENIQELHDEVKALAEKTEVTAEDEVHLKSLEVCAGILNFLNGLTKNL